MKKICVIGNFSGRNAGDAAILETLMNDIYSIHKEVKFLVPTINKTFVEKTFKRFPVKGVPLMPWNLSVKIFGLPIFRSVLSSDLVLVTDNILFDRGLWNPLYNYLSTMALVLPMAKKKGIPVVLYNASLGPVTSFLGKMCMKRVIDSSEQIILRDQDSRDILERLSLQHNNIIFAADCALNISIPDAKRLEQIKKDESILDQKHKYIGFNITSYMNVFVKDKERGLRTERILQIMAEALDKMIQEMKIKIVMIVTQPMDMAITKKLLDKMEMSDHTSLVSNIKYSHNDIAGILSQLEVHVGMRTHSLIFSAAFCTPMVSIIAYPKTTGFIKTIEQTERIIEFDNSFSSDKLFTLVNKTWEDRHIIRKNMEPIIKREKNKAKSSANLITRYLS